MRIRALVLMLVLLAAAVGVACKGRTAQVAAGPACTEAACACVKTLTWTKLPPVAGSSNVRWALARPTCSGRRMQVLDQVQCDSTGGMDPTCGYDIDSMVVVGSPRGG